ncbi:MAG TPA: GH3 auxin-responsive promoter family protein [Vicinamibacteria bacterium]
MIPIVRAALWTRERGHLARFEDALKSPERAQARVLERLVRGNQDTAFGREHGFAEIRSPGEYARRVPVRDYEAFRPYVDRLAAGQEQVLTREPVVMFTTTSGTTSLPKLIPVTASWRDEMASLTRLWMLRAGRDHPACFDRKVFYLASPAIEGRTARGTPYGALTGVLYQRIPWVVRRQYSLPYAVSIIAEPDARYFVTMRLALAQVVSLACTPNPTSLIRLAETAAGRADEIVRAIRDGTLGIPLPETLPSSGYSPARAAAEIMRGVAPQPARARELTRIMAEHGAFNPGLCWPELALIGCWLGGSAALHARRMGEYLGPAVPLRDLGFLASEGRFTIPVEDATAAGPLAVHTSFFEFIPEGAIEEASPPALLAHELQDGQRYYVLISGGNGLYRYDINDVVEVHGFHRRTPKIRFVRKGRDMVSITGEKLHLNQLQAAARDAERDTGLQVWQFRVIPDVERLRYDLLLETRSPVAAPAVPAAFAEAFDRSLCASNIEYASKRKSRRLHPPLLHLMQRGWADRLCRADFRAGKREAQYKWPAIRDAWDEASRAEVVATVAAADPFAGGRDVA